jgi:hypothetical protein
MLNVYRFVKEVKSYLNPVETYTPTIQKKSRKLCAKYLGTFINCRMFIFLAPRSELHSERISLMGSARNTPYFCLHPEIYS